MVAPLLVAGGIGLGLGGGTAALDFFGRRGEIDEARRQSELESELERQFISTILGDPNDPFSRGDPLFRQAIATFFGQPGTQPFDPAEITRIGQGQINTAAQRRGREANQAISNFGLDDAQRLFAQSLIERTRDFQLRALEEAVDEAAIAARPLERAESAAGLSAAVLGRESALLAGLS